MGWASFYYVQAPKHGHLFHTGTKMAFEDYQVSGDWVWSLLQSRKVDLATARRELVRTSKCLTRHLPNMEKLVQESIALELQDVIARKEKYWLAAGLLSKSCLR